MQCPVCTSDLQPVHRGGIEIDVCSRCKGVWLDRGELDKLVSAANGYYSTRRGDDDSDFGDGSDYGRPSHGPHHYGNGGHPPGGYPPRKKKGFFGRKFDFD
jgi:uncharacterized protein